MWVRRLRTPALVAFALVVVAAATVVAPGVSRAGATAAPPTVTAVSPLAGPTAGSTTVTVTGTNLTGASAVHFGTALATNVTVDSPTKLTASSPAHTSGTVTVTVRTPGGTSATSSADHYTYDPVPSVTSLSPKAGPTSGGTIVTVTGSGFVSGTTTVKFGTKTARSVAVTSTTSLTAKSPTHSVGTVTVTVTTPGGTSAVSTADHFTYDTKPAVSALSPSAGPTAGGTTVTITGSGFVSGASVTFGTLTAASVSFVSTIRLRATSPAHAAGPVSVVVTTPGGASNKVIADVFDYTGAPSVTGISPDLGPTSGSPVDTPVTITGSGLGRASAVRFGSLTGTRLHVVSTTEVTAMAPAEAAGTVDVTVTTPGGTSSTGPADHFSYDALVVTGLAPFAGATGGGTKVTLSGSGFGGATAVSFGGVAAKSFTVVSTTTITATTPAASAGTVEVTVTTPAGTTPTSPASDFTFDARPTVSAISVSSGSVTGGTAVTVTGTGFAQGATVTFGTAASSSVSVESSTSLVTVSPPLLASTVAIKVTDPGGTSAAVTADKFSYKASSGTGKGVLTWGTQVNSPTLDAVSCPTSVHCVVVGGGTNGTAAAYVTSSSGGFWTPSTVPSGTAPLAFVACAPGGTFCVATTTKAVVQSTDGGITWTVATLPKPGLTPLGHFRGVSCPTATVCVLASSGYAVYTTNSGATWAASALAGTYLYSVSCTSATWCLVTTGRTGRGNSDLFKSAGSLATWTQLAAPGATGTQKVSCSSPSDCVDLRGGTAYESIDGGTTWTMETSGIGGTKNGSPLAIACVVYTSFCAAVGGKPTTFRAATGVTKAYTVRAIAFESTNGGTTWTAEHLAAGARATLTSVSCASTRMCMAVGADALSVTLTGATWVRETQSLAVDGSIACPSASTCYVGMRNGLVQETLDAGAVWQRPELVPSDGSTSMRCFTTKRCISFATTGIRATTDGGASWQVRFNHPYVASGAAYRSMSCPSQTQCYVVGNGPRALGTGPPVVLEGGVSTGFSSFTHLPTLTYTRLDAISCPTTTTCYVLANHTNNWDVYTVTTGLSKWALSTAFSASSPSAFTCPAVTECLVGTQNKVVTNEGHPSSYSAITLPNAPTGATPSVSVVSCESKTLCLAGGGSHLLADTAFAGSGTWQYATLPANTVGSINAVACANATTCWLVGQGVNQQGAVILSTNGVAGPGSYLEEGAQSLGVATAFGAFNPSEPCFACALRAAGVPAQMLTSDPVDTADGDFSESLPLVDVQGLGPPLAFTATYDAQEAQAQVKAGATPGSLGWGWNYPAQMSLSSVSTGQFVTVDQENGSQVSYEAASAWPQGGCTTDPVDLQCYVPTNSSNTATLELFRPTGTYTFARANLGTTFSFSSAGQLLSVEDVHGETTTFTYGVAVGTSSCPSTPLVATCTLETDPTGRILRYGMDSAGQLVTLTDPDANKWTFAYDASGNLSSVTSPRNAVTSFGYDTTDPTAALDHDLVSLTRPNGQPGGPDAGHHETIVYNTKPTQVTTGWVTSLTDPAGLVTGFSYTLPTGPGGSGTVTVTDPHANKTLDAYQGGALSSATAGYTTTAPSTTTYARTQRTLLPTSVIDPLGRTTTMRWSTAGKLLSETAPVVGTTTSTYNALGEPLTTTDPMGIKTVHTYDGFGDLKSTTVDADSACTSACTQVTTDAVCQSTTCSANGHTYAIGEVESVTDPRGYTTTYTYDPYGYPTTTALPDGATSATAHDPDGRLYCIVAADAYAKGTRCPSSPSTRVADTTSATFDATGDVVTSTDPLGNTTTSTYDGDANLTKTTDPMANVTTTTYDADDRPTAVTSGAGTPTASTSTTTYDIPAASCPSAPSGTTYCVQSSVGTTTNTTTDYYDAQDRLVKSAPPSNSSATGAAPQLASTTHVYNADGEVTSTTNGAGTTKYTYDKAGRLTQVSYSSQKAGYTKPSTVCYAYDADSRRTSMTAAPCGTTGAKSVYTYDGYERLVKVTDTATHSVTYGYDPTGDLTCLSYPQTTLTHDCAHAGSGTGVVTYAYDHADRMSQMTDWQSKSTTFSYDTTQNLTGVTFPTTTAASLAYTYDADSSVKTATLTDAAVTPTSPYKRQLSALTYNADELVATSALTGGTPLTYAYDHRSELTTGQTTQPESEGYSYDLRGDRTSLTPTGAGPTYASYNTDQELCATAGSSSPSCTIPSSGTTLYGFTTQGERCYSAVSTSTSAGCSTPPVGSTTATYTWDQAGDLICATTPNATGKTCTTRGAHHTTTYTYNGDGLRTSETPNTGTTEHFTWDSATSIPRVLEDGSYEYLYGPSGTALEAIALSGGAHSYLASDDEGVRMVLAATGGASGSAKYASYGTAAVSAGLPLGFQGAYTDPNGLVYLIHRYYDPTTAQFLSVDPLVDATGQPYSYASDDPVNNVDPTGLCNAQGNGNAWDLFNPWSSNNPIRCSVEKNPNSMTSKVLKANPAYQAINGYYNEYAAAQNPCSSNWSLAGDAAQGALGLVGTGLAAFGGFADGLVGTAGEEAPGAISGFTQHGLQQALGREGVGVSDAAMVDAVANPTDVVAQSGGRYMFVGQNAVVVLNSNGEVITTWATNSAGWRVVP